jgi:hypothetical protein
LEIDFQRRVEEELKRAGFVAHPLGASLQGVLYAVTTA